MMRELIVRWAIKPLSPGILVLAALLLPSMARGGEQWGWPSWDNQPPTPQWNVEIKPTLLSLDTQSADLAAVNSTAPALDTLSGSPPAPAAVPSPTQPEASSAVAGQFPAIAGSFGLQEFFLHFAPHEPMYFIGGWQAPNIKFQFSLRYRLLTPTGPLATQYPFLKGFNFAYTQTSFWDVSNPDQPFFYDSSYRPEFFYYLENLPRVKLPPSWQVGAQAGIGHESNGQKDPNHRSLNIIYLRPIVTVGGSSNGWFFTLAPKFYYYIGDLNLNPDLPRFRGYCDLRLVVGRRDGLQLATIGRVGSRFNRGSAQFDLTYPLTKIFNGNTDVSLDAQYFLGYGDSLLTYNRRSSVFRLGLAIVR